MKLAAAAVLLSPYVPLLFMGEEYGETAPFQYFVSHSDPAIIEAVRKGRSEEFAEFQWAGELPDPQDERTFSASKLRWDMRNEGDHRALLNFYGELLRLRRKNPVLRHLDLSSQEVKLATKDRAIFTRRWHEKDEVFGAFYFGEAAAQLPVPMPAGRWVRGLDSADLKWNGPGSEAAASVESSGNVELAVKPYSVVMYARSNE